MARGHISVEGLAELQAKLSLVALRARAAAGEALQQEVNAVKSDAVGFAPSDTGTLREGIRGEVMALDGKVESTERYGRFVEHGTYKDRAQPFMAPAADLSRVRWPARAGALIKTALEGLGR